MIRELATVVAYENGLATVSCQQKSGCSGCASASQCGMSALEKLTGDNPHQHTLQLTCREPLQVGQQVEIGISERSLLSSAFVMYCVPLLGLIISAVLASLFTANELPIIAVAMAGTAVGIGVSRYLARHLSRQATYQPVILRNLGVPLSCNSADAVNLQVNVRKDSD
ncbi:SoxR reducing system RseC family protein [Plesiomonas shigelloides]|uniref:SoxR reducing system RseC family protein n=1 Tax=Plesiomonas shigelloides TaxID=703 RepID=UPI003EBCC11B